MIKSMTGYGRGGFQTESREFTVEIRSVNNRYLDCSVRMPRSISFAEDAVKQAVKKQVGRGKVDVTVSLSTAAQNDISIQLNRPVLEGYLKAMREMVDDYGVQDDISVSVLSRLPDVYCVEKAEQDEAQLTQELLTALQTALDAYDLMRCTEGQAMENDLQARRQTILQLVAQVEAGSPQTVADYRSRLEAKMREVLENTSIDESRILTEAAIFADKVAVDEETVRLRSHLNQMDSMLRSGGAIGRKLDFLLQEMNREANTIGSKCSDVRLARIVVEIKAELEKIREQVQNIE